MNSSIRKEMNRRYALLRKGQRNLSDLDAQSQYCKQHNCVSKIMREAEIEYWKDKFENANSSGNFWRVVREMQGKSKGHMGAIKNEDGHIIINVKEKVESFNHFFSKVGEILQTISLQITMLMIINTFTNYTYY